MGPDTVVRPEPDRFEVSQDAHTSIRAALRARTASGHRLLDRHPVLAPLMRPSVQLDDYIAVVRGLHGPQCWLENHLHAMAVEAGLLPRSDALDADLQALGTRPFPLVVAPPLFDDDASRLGALYVLEGSHMGAVMIARHLQRTLGPTLPCRFFAAGEGAPRWERFWAWAVARLQDDDLPAMVDAAQRTFRFFNEHLDTCPVPTSTSTSPAPPGPQRHR